MSTAKQNNVSNKSIGSDNPNTGCVKMEGKNGTLSDSLSSSEGSYTEETTETSSTSSSRRANDEKETHSTKTKSTSGLSSSTACEKIKKKELTWKEIDRLRVRAKTVEHIWIGENDLEFCSDEEISDASVIWSDYGDEILVDDSLSNKYFIPQRFKMSQKLTKKERRRAIKDSAKSKTNTKKKKTKLHAKMRSLSSTKKSPEEQFFDINQFSDIFKQTLIEMRKKNNEEIRSSISDKSSDAAGGSSKSGMSLSDRSKSGSHRDSTRSSSRRNSKPTLSRTGSRLDSQSSLTNVPPLLKKSSRQSSNLSALPSQFLSPGGGTSPMSPMTPGSKSSEGFKSALAIKQMAKQKLEMWDNMSGFWKMVRAEEKMIITPLNYSQQLDPEFRMKEEIINHKTYEASREKCSQWIVANLDYFST